MVRPLSLSVALLLLVIGCDPSQASVPNDAPELNGPADGGTGGTSGSESGEGSTGGDASSTGGGEPANPDDAPDGEAGTTISEPPCELQPVTQAGPGHVEDLQGCIDGECGCCQEAGWSISFLPPTPQWLGCGIETAAPTDYLIEIHFEQLGGVSTPFPRTLVLPASGGPERVVVGCEVLELCGDHHPVSWISIDACDANSPLIENPTGCGGNAGPTPLVVGAELKDQSDAHVPAWCGLDYCETLPDVPPGAPAAPEFVSGTESPVCLKSWPITWTASEGASSYQARWKCGQFDEVVVDLGDVLESDPCALGMCEGQCAFDLKEVRIQACNGEGCSAPTGTPESELPGSCGPDGLCC